MENQKHINTNDEMAYLGFDAAMVGDMMVRKGDTVKLIDENTYTSMFGFVPGNRKHLLGKMLTVKGFVATIDVDAFHDKILGVMFYTEEGGPELFDTDEIDYVISDTGWYEHDMGYGFEVATEDEIANFIGGSV